MRKQIGSYVRVLQHGRELNDKTGNRQKNRGRGEGARGPQGRETTDIQARFGTEKDSERDVGDGDDKEQSYRDTAHQG